MGRGCGDDIDCKAEALKELVNEAVCMVHLVVLESLLHSKIRWVDQIRGAESFTGLLTLLEQSHRSHAWAIKTMLILLVSESILRRTQGLDLNSANPFFFAVCRPENQAKLAPLD